MGNLPQSQVEGVVATSIKAAEEATSATIPPEVMEKCMATAEVGDRVRFGCGGGVVYPPQKTMTLSKWHKKLITCFGDFLGVVGYWSFGFES